MQNKLTIPIPKGIADVVFSDEIGETPANCNLKTRIIKLNPEYWKKLNDDQRFYVIAHEAGHINLQTRSEFEADQYASKLYLESGRSPKESVFSISKVLPLNNYEQRKRLEYQLERASEYDYQINKNNNALKILKIMNENTENELDEFESSYYGDDDDYEEGFGGRFAKNRAQRHDRKELKKTSKIERKNTKVASKAAAREQKAEAKVLKAQSGEPGAGANVFAKAMEGLKQVGETVGQIRGGQASPEGMPGGDGGQEDKKILGLKATTFYIVAGVTAAVVIVGLWLAFKPKKKQAA
ncbi:MAG: hypothetical protein Q7W13_14030 [Bacteroidia bacterium]|nr:hypothetical protein [Bacteroidia bacterium]